MKTTSDTISYEVLTAVELIRLEMQKPNPDGIFIFELLNGDKYNHDGSELLNN